MKINLDEHHVPGKYQAFHCLYPTPLDADHQVAGLWIAHDAERGYQPIQIVLAVGDSSVMRIAQKVVRPIGIHLTSDQRAPEESLSWKMVVILQEITDLLGGYFQEVEVVPIDDLCKEVLD